MVGCTLLGCAAQPPRTASTHAAPINLDTEVPPHKAKDVKPVTVQQPNITGPHQINIISGSNQAFDPNSLEIYIPPGGHTVEIIVSGKKP